MKTDKKMRIVEMAVQNLKAKKFRTSFMMFFVLLMSATVFFSTLLMDNLELGIKNTTERMGADVIVVPDEGTEHIRDSLFAGTPCSVFFDASWEDAVRGVEGVERVSAQMYVATLAASCCDASVQLVAFDPETDFVVKPWLEKQNNLKLKTGEVLVGGEIVAAEGDVLTFYDTKFEVKGVLEKTGMGYDHSVFMTFETLYELKNSKMAQESLPMDEMENMISMLMVDTMDGLEGVDKANVLIDIEKAGNDGTKMEACTADQLMSGVSEQVKRLSGYGNILTYISILSAALALISIFVITINERKYEFGILYTLGASKKQMTNIILSEALIISVIGGVAGVGIAYGLIANFKNFISVKLDIPYLDVSLGQALPIAGICIIIAILTGVIAAVCSAYRISKGEAYRLIRESE